MVLVSETIRQIETLAPPALAESWDNCGLQTGDPGSRVERILVALTPLPEVFDEAEAKDANFVLLHHPLIFEPLTSLDTGVYPGNLLSRAIRDRTNVYAAHTSYDAAPDGVSVALAEALGLSEGLEVVSSAGSLEKLVVFVPEEDADEVADALSGAGAGVIGDYTHCAFRTRGTGTFLPGETSNPHLGARGELESVAEVRLETVVPSHLTQAAVEAATEVHPYEEMAHDIYPVAGSPEDCGFGRLGALEESLNPQELCDLVSERLGFPARLLSCAGRREIERVAVLGGSGGSFIPKVAASGADAYITGDLGYHDALLAESLGLTAIDAGHAATELPSLSPLAERLSGLVEVPIEVSEIRR